ncbi:ATP-binding cassette domain-containing protein [Rarobacter incanus]|uniref:ABC-2 type transport system ATP-binding protein n=1 Tax=Rarobacter incanus TaxID=153494 RepID=A0A542SQQ4_9MICO|nr:ATP-binding cassette domain-containing protein [Rarobacter incanus]TQK76951.1 ABC-2 type transport system ATP-binding protein [Rarobacter incanus]
MEPTTAPAISIRSLTKRYGAREVVSKLSFDVHPGRVTGFLGPNGAGKTTTLRMLLGLARPTSGSASFGHLAYADLPDPGKLVGASIAADAFHPGRTARDHLRVYAPAVGAAERRIDELLGFLGIADAAQRRVGEFSTGMRQRLSLATALLGDPQVLILDEPTNGLDPEGIAWLREFLRAYAARGRAVLVSSHMLLEVQQSVDDVVVIARGTLIHASSLADLSAMAVATVRVAGPDMAGLRDLATRRGWTIVGGSHRAASELELRGIGAAAVGKAAFDAGIELHELVENRPSLEDVFLQMVSAAEPDSHVGVGQVPS